MTARRLHLYLGVFFAPLIIFFAFTGILQTFGLHESKVRGEPPPSAWIASLAEIHKNQRLRNESRPGPKPAPSVDRPAMSVPPSAAPSETPAAAPRTPSPERVPPKENFVLKIFVALMSVALMLSSLLGIYIALTIPRTKKITWICVILGCILPVLLLMG